MFPRIFAWPLGLLAFVSVAAGPAAAQAPAPVPEPPAAGPSFKPLFELRLRGEHFATPSAAAARDRTYALGLVRLRAGGDLTWRQRFTLHGLLQGAATTTLPENAAFGSGPTYFSTNGNAYHPHQLDVAELAFVYRSKSLTIVAGRQGWADGAGPATGIALLDYARTRRLSERLVGNLDFANVGRRFDGVTAVAGFAGAGGLEVFALRPLAGAFNYEQAFEELDIALYGAAWASPHGAWVPRSTVRLFAQTYDDRRDVTRAVTGAEIDLATVGASILTGDDSWNVLLWGALQSGDFGRRAQSASAFLLDAGWRWARVAGAPSVHFCWEQASGGGAAGDSRNFFNLLPTNHKFYGALDYSAFSNLRDISLEGRWSPVKPLALSAALHDFSLVDRSGPWVGGSGAFSDRELGYVFRRPANGGFTSDAIGRELDIAATWILERRLQIKFEGGLFWGGDAAREVLVVEPDGSWASLELTYKL